MAVSQVYRSNPIRMMGMASGMDTQSIIDATLRMHQFKIDKQMRQRQLIEWKQSYHNDIKNQIQSLKNTYLSNLGSKTMMNRNVFNTNVAKATIGGVETNAVTVTASVNAGLGNLTIDRIERLASNSSASSASSVSASGDGFLTSQTLGSLAFTGGGINFGPDKANVTTVSGGSVILNRSEIEGSGVEWSNGVSNISVSKDQNAYSVSLTKNSNGTYSYDASMVKGTDSPELTSGSLTFSGGIGLIEFSDGTKIEISLDSINEDKFTYKATNDENEEIGAGADGFSYSGTYGSGDSQVALRKDANGNIAQADGRAINYYGETSIKVNNTDITLTSNMTISEMLNRVNTLVPSVTMSYDRMSDKFTITNKNNGDPAVTIADNGGNIVEKMFGSDDVTGSASQTALVYINGETEGRQFDSNNFTFRGVSIRLNETSTQPITVSVSRDTDKAVDAIKDFINSYNALISKLEGLLSDRKKGSESSYTPLTDEEKATMTEKQIEEWEAIAKKGIMRDDRTIQNLVSSLRASFFEQIEGTGLSASQLGLTTGSYFDGTGGQIIITEEGEKRLRAALEEDPDRVADVFVKIDNTNGLKGVGLMHKIDDILNNYIKLEGPQDIAIKALEKSYAEMNERIAKLEERMWAEEDKLYRQFAAMETALSKMQQQGDWFSAMLGA